MKQITHNFTCLSPFHSGSDTTGGFVRECRKTPVLLIQSRHYQTIFPNEEARIDAIAYMLYLFWQNIPDTARTTIYDEIQSAIVVASGSGDRYRFIDRLCERFDVRAIKPSKALSIFDILALFCDDTELFESVRFRSRVIITKLRILREWQKAGRENPQELEKIAAFEEGIRIVEEYNELRDIGTRRQIVNVPSISGNSIRGILRRLAASDFCRRCGLLDAVFSSNDYHMIFTGGILSESFSHENMAFRRELIQHNPLFEVFGTAYNSGMMQSAMKVGNGNLVCIENEKTAGEHKRSCFELVSTVFGTRSDTEKTQVEIGIAETPNGERDTHQMYYEMECVIPGAEFEHEFLIESCTQLGESAFVHSLNLLAEHGYLGGKSAAGYGKMDFQNLSQTTDSMIQAGVLPAATVYLDHLKDRREEIRAFWAARRDEQFSRKKKK